MSLEVSQAVFAGDVAALRSLSAHDAALFQRVTQSEEWNLLHIALLHPKELAPLAMVQYLLEQGVSPNASDCYGNTPLHYAARAKYTDAMGLLLDFGAEVDPMNLDKVTPLRQTLLSKPYSLEATELLLARGASPEAKGRTGKTVRAYVEVIAHGEDASLLELFDRYQERRATGA